MTAIGEMTAFLDEYLSVGTIEDPSCNGLQVQGVEQITAIGLAVDACRAVYEKTVENGCQMLIVHHGMIWGGLSSITGNVYRNVRYLIEHGLNLYAAHLPLDLHPDVGNNARLAALLNLDSKKPFGKYKGMMIGFSGALPSAVTPEQLGEALRRELGGPITILPFGTKEIRTAGVVSGGGSDCLEEAIAGGLDCMITGEPQHWNHHLALECGINVIYCGHYHSEKTGVCALGQVVEKRFGVRTVFLDVPTIV